MVWSVSILHDKEILHEKTIKIIGKTMDKT